MKALGLLFGAGVLALSASQADATVLLTLQETGSATASNNQTTTVTFANASDIYQTQLGDFNVKASFDGSATGTTPDLFTQTLDVSSVAAATLTVTIQQLGLAVVNTGSLLSTFTANGNGLQQVVESTYANGGLLATRTFGPNVNGVNNLGASYSDANPGLSSLTSDAVRFVITANTAGARANSTTNIQAGAMGAVPEPASWALMLAGFGFMGYSLRQRRRATVSFG